MRVLFLAAEAAPLVKIGGLADVAGELPRALRARGLEVRLVLPWHAALSTQGLSPRRVAEVVVPYRHGGIPAQVHAAEMAGLPVWLISGEPIGSSPSVYGDPARDSLKYAFFCLAALRAAESLAEIPDLVHGNDWHSAAAILAVARARRADGPWQDSAALLTIHNLPYMGVGGGEALEDFGLTATTDERLPDWARLVPLAQALVEADWLTTVSPTYAREIQSPEHGAGLEGVLAARADHLTGILNGLDLDRWDPARDKALYQRFNATDLAKRKRNKSGLLADLGLDSRGDLPLLAMVTRLDQQKGVDLALDALQWMPRQDWQFVLLGKGIFKGPMSRLQFVPDQETDFVFTVVAEETGFLGSLALLALFGLLLYRSIAIAAAAKDTAGRAIAGGTAAVFLMHLLVNVGMTLGMMPVKGMPLPFVSYGGSNMLTMMALAGLLQSIYVHRQKITF